MRKFTLTLLAATGFAVCSSAQLRVIESGQAQIGNFETSSSGSLSQKLATDTVAALRIGGKGFNASGGRVSFGSGSVYIEELQYSGNLLSSKAGFLKLGSSSGFSLSTGSNVILSFNPSLLQLGSSVKTLNSSVAVSAPQYLTSSDARIKTDIEPLYDMGMLLSGISPVSYRLAVCTDEHDSGSKARKKDESVFSQHQYGFLAQDVREVYPDLVYEDSEGMLSIDYTGFIAILVDAVKDLQTQVRIQAETIESLRRDPETIIPNNGSVVASLSQNRPNPFNTSTVIGCVLPKTVSEAFLCVYDLNGNQKLRKDITERGDVDITIEGNTMAAGMYIYTLVADGVEIDSKRMILTD